MESDGVNDLAWVDCFVDSGVSPKGFHVVRKLLQIRSTNLKIDMILMLIFTYYDRINKIINNWFIIKNQ